ncbi:MAG: tetratricopeptide repeat protein [Pseudomonadota bacterium]
MLGIVGIIFALQLVGTTAQADFKDRARKHFVQGKAYFAQGEYKKAISAFYSASSLMASPLLDLNIARCHEKLGNNKAAIRLYKKYLKKTPEASDREKVQAHVQELEKRIAPKKEDVYIDLEQEIVAKVEQPSTQPSAVQSSSETTSAPTSQSTSQPTIDQMELPHEASSAAARENAIAPGGPLEPINSEEGPVYKQWWFWGVCGVAIAVTAFVIITSIPVHSSSNQIQTISMPERFQASF